MKEKSGLLNRKIGFYDFELIIGKTPFTSTWLVGSSVSAYFVVLYILGQYMQNRPAFKLDKFSAFHNFFLAIFSAITAGGILVELIIESRLLEHKNNPVEWCFCIPRGQRLVGPIYFWTYLYYLSKYYELIDSFLIVLRKSKKGLSFLHVIHHSSMMLFSYSWFLGGFGTMWLGAFLNSIVHTLMYTYYGFTSLGKRWRFRYCITIIQMIQFILGAMYFVYFFSGRFFFHSNCSGNLVIMIANLSFDLLFFYLFSRFYEKEFKEKSCGKKQESLHSSSIVEDKQRKQSPNEKPALKLGRMSIGRRAMFNGVVQAISSIPASSVASE